MRSGGNTRRAAPSFGGNTGSPPEQESGEYRIEARRGARDRLGAIDAELFVVWNEGRADEAITIVPLHFDPEHRATAWLISGTTLREVAPLTENVPARR